jgi:hypothetical protein
MKGYKIKWVPIPYMILAQKLTIFTQGTDIALCAAPCNSNQTNITILSKALVARNQNLLFLYELLRRQLILSASGLWLLVEPSINEFFHIFFPPVYFCSSNFY